MKWTRPQTAPALLRGALFGALFGVLGLTSAGCATYDGPPELSIVGADQGQLKDPTAPIVLSFSKTPDLSTLRIKIARYIVDDEGNLGDEDQSDETNLDLLYQYDPKDGDSGGTSVIADDHKTMTITLDVVPSVGTPLVVLVEPGLADETGAKTVARRRVIFTYQSSLTCDAPVSVVKSGTYFFIAGITKPIATKVHLWAVVEMDPTTGQFKARFTKAKRNPDPNRCPTPCASTEACRLLPEPACVAPSTPAGSVDEFPDYVVDANPPAGFGFLTDGCSADQGGGMASFANRPVDIEVQQPKVTLRNAALTASFSVDADNILRGSGSLVADAVLLGIIDSGKGQGDLTVRSVPDDQAPTDLEGP
ncbi:Hypothetical protein A7982_02812 [Minicystis rosea]|nr:Hypothetical protein A7982_02812 [Minicystis rosea]